MNRQSTPLWDSSQIATPNQHRSGLTINKQVSLKLCVRLQRLRGKPRHPKTRPEHPKTCQLQPVKHLLFVTQSQNVEVKNNTAFINVHEKFPGTIRSRGTRSCTKIEGGIQRSIHMPMCLATRRLLILQMQPLTVSGRLSGDPPFLRIPTTRACNRNFGKSEVPRRSEVAQKVES